MLNRELVPAYVEWTRQTVSLLKIGGKWGIPMWPGVIVTRTDDNECAIDYGPNYAADSDDMEVLALYLRAAGFHLANDRNGGAPLKDTFPQ